MGQTKEQGQVNVPSFYTVIPATVRYDNNLSSGAKLLYGDLGALTNLEGKCWASNKTLAKWFGITERTVQNYLKELKDCGHIYIEILRDSEANKITKREIYITHTKINSPGGGENNFHRGGENNFVYNNTSNTNNTSIYSQQENKPTKNDLLVKDTEELLARNNVKYVDIITKHIKSIADKHYLVNYHEVFLELFKVICDDLSVPRVFSAKRKKALNAILKHYSFNEVITVLENVKGSDFLSGRISGKTWKANLDWILKIENFDKIFNGEYNRQYSSNTVGNLAGGEIIKAGRKVEDVTF